MGCGDFAQFLFKSIFKTIMSEKKSAIRLSRLTIKNYKKIDYLEIDFPRPLMKGDADILVFGSKNGGGKTSVLECCSLVVLAGVLANGFSHLLQEESQGVVDFLVKAGEKGAFIQGEFEKDNKKCIVNLDIYRGLNMTRPRIEGDFDILKFEKPSFLISSIFSFSSEPIIVKPLLHFNSYRKIHRSNPTLGAMIESSSSNPISTFKMEIINALLSKAGVIKGINNEESKQILKQLNNIVQSYCGGQILELNPQSNSTFEILITPTDGSESFSFDGLSSGQKEMIATLFLIWKNTKDQPSIVLIDEPELHLNAEWQSGFVRQLHKIAPNNQYILATHSETIFRSVDRNHRGLLDSNDNGVK